MEEGVCDDGELENAAQASFEGSLYLFSEEETAVERNRAGVAADLAGRARTGQWLAIGGGRVGT